MQKVRIIEAWSVTVLQSNINEFAKTHHIEQISYVVSSHGYEDCYSCCILYIEKEN